MKGTKRIVMMLLAAASMAQGATPYYAVRSQSVDSARELVGLVDILHRYDPSSCEPFSNFAVTFEYTRSFRAHDIARCLFGDGCLQVCDDCPTIKISGSRVADRSEKDWLADYFGLPTDFESTITIRPSIENYLVDFDYFRSLNNICNGLYFKVHAPVVHTKRNLNYCEIINNRGENEHDAGYFTATNIDRTDLLDSFGDYITACKTPRIPPFILDNSNLGQTIVDAVFSVTQEPLACSKWGSACDRLSETRLSDIHLLLGYDMWECPDYHVGFGIRAAIPTGNRPDCKFLFEPIVGNGHHWELGGNFNAHYDFWQGCNGNSLGLYVDFNITHLFKDRQCRVFDLKNGCNSRYMLALKLDTPVIDLMTSETPNSNPLSIPNSQFKDVFTPVANLTKSFVDVSSPIQIDFTTLFHYSNNCCNYSFDVGYNFWYRSCEQITFNSCDLCPIPLENNRRWALKGDASVYGFADPPNRSKNVSGFVAVPLSPSQSQATIHQGTNNYLGPYLTSPPAGLMINGDLISPNRNPGVDNAAFAEDGFNGLICAVPNVLDQILTSQDPIFLSTDDIDVCGARTRGLSHKIFAHLSYEWCEDECGYAPFLGVGGSVEFGQNSAGSSGACKTDCNDSSCAPANLIGDCAKCAVSQWGIWLKGGITFN